MKHCWAFFFVIFSSLGMAQLSFDFEEIIRNYYQEVHSDFKTEQLSDYFTADALLLNDGEKLDFEGIQNLLLNLKGQFETAQENGRNLSRKHDIRFLDAKEDGQNAWLVYENKAEFMMDGAVVATLNWLESAVFVLQEKVWKIQLLHASLIKEKNK